MALLATPPLRTAAAQEPAAATGFYKPGGVAVSGFAGAKLQEGSLKPGVDPATKTVIDPDGVTLKIYDATLLGGPMAGQEAAPAANSFTARDLGHVFGLAFDARPATAQSAPALYAGASSAFGLHVTGPDADGDGRPERLSKGAAGATFMDGLFGAGGGPGTIWKIDQATGAVSRFTDVTSNGQKNTGAGLGGLAIDAASGTLYVSDLDTGLVHRLRLDAGATDLGQYDHGVTARPAAGKTAVRDDGKRLDITSPAFVPADSATWGRTQPARRVEALAVHQGRLFYSVAEGPEIWSVGLDADGSFKSDSRLELPVKGEKAYPITAIAFDSTGRMILAERGAQKNPADYSAFVENGPARVLRFEMESPDDPATPGPWKLEPQEYAIGSAKPHRDSSGGVALQHGYNADGTLDSNACGGTLVASASALGPDLSISGVQLNPVEAIRAADGLAAEHIYIGFDPSGDDPEVRGHSGGVAVLQDCSGAGFPPVADGGGAFPPVTDGGGGGFPPVAGGGFPPVAGGEEPTFPPVTDEGIDPGGGGTLAALTVTKTAGVDKCNPKGGCAFNIEVRNDTAEAIPGPIVINEQIEAPQALLTGEPNAPWICTKAAPFTCTHPGPVAAGGSLLMRVVFAPNLPPEAKEVRNCAALQGGGAGAAAPAPACATIPLDPNAPAQTGPVIISKKGAGQCTAKGPCPFTVSVTNITNADVPGPIVVRDVIDAPQATLTGAPNAPWNCINAPPAIDCTHPGPLKANSTAELQLSFTPNTPPDKTELKNCATPPLGGGGNNAPPVVPNQLVPGKRTEFFKPRRIAAAPQSFAMDNGLLHLTGGAGGSIGGVTNNCLEHGLPASLFVKQSNGYVVTFRNLKVTNGSVTGEAQADTQSCTQYLIGCVATEASVLGRAEGSYRAADRQLRLKVTWNNGAIADYKLVLGADGSFAGTGTHENAAGKPQAALSNGAAKIPLACTRNEICDAYVKAATETAKKYNRLKCGPDDPPGRYSSDQNLHLNWCMSQPASSTLLQSETQARTAKLKECEELQTRKCEKFADTMLHFKAEADRRKCEALQPNVLPPRDDLIATCRNTGDVDEFINRTIPEAQSKLSACPPAQAADAGGGAGGQQGGGAGGGAQPDKAVEPAPEQCAVVPIELDLPPGEVAKGEVGKPATAANGIEITKAISNGAACTADGCTFVVTLRNTTGQPIAGPIKFFDQLTGAAGPEQKLLKTSLVAPPAAPWTCAPQAGAPIFFECTHPGPLAAGQSLTATMSMKLANAAGLTEIRNCAIADEKAISCVTAPQKPTAPPQPSAAGALTLTKTAGTCRDNRACDFTVSVTNTGNAAFDGRVDFVDTPTADGAFLGATTITAGGPWMCTKAQFRFDCAAGLQIAANEKKDFTFTVDIGAGAGAVKEIKNCGRLKDAAQESCAIAALGQAPPAPPPAPVASRLVLNKTAVVEKCSDAGGGCDFVVSITNTSDTDFTDPIAFTDSLSTADGRPLPNADFGSVQAAGVGGPDINAPFVCTKGGGAMTCATGALPVKIPPKRTVTFPMSIKPGAGTGATAIRNCATLLLQGAQEPVCRNIPLVTGPLLRATKTTAATTCNPECAFGVSIKNVGNADAFAPFTFTERFTPAPKIIAINAKEGGDYTCRLAPEQGHGVAVCNGNKNVLKPGEQFIGTILVNAVPLAPEYKNCIEISPAAGPVDTTFPGSCVTIKEPRPQRADLAVMKLAQDKPTAGGKLGECKLEGPCNFKVIVINRGNTTYSGPITFTDEVPAEPRAGATQSIPAGIEIKADPAWTCTKANPRSISCTHTKTSLVPGDGVSVDVVVTPGPGWKKNNVLMNCARIATPVGNDAGDNKVNDAQCAESLLDPFAVAVEKTGDAACPPGSNCTFKITLRNPGPIDHNAPVTITDGLRPRVTAQIVSISPPLPCASQPTQIPFSCSSPGPVRLDLDAPAGSEFGPREYTMVVKMPSDGSADAYRNCISVTGGEGGTGEEACHTVATKPVALSVSKTAASANCDETTPCKFNIKVANASASPIPGPIVVSDLTRVGRTPLTNIKLVSASEPWMCISSAAPGMQCHHPGPVPAGGSLDLALSLQPLAGSLAGATEVRNCAGLAGDSTAEAGACASIPVKAAPSPPPAPAPPAVTPPSSACFGGMILTGGTCACPPPMQWNGRKCIGTGGSDRIQPNDEAAVPAAPAEPPTSGGSCPGDMVRIAGACACQPPAKWNGRKCAYTGGADKVYPNDPKPPRPQPQPVPPPTRACPEGFTGTPPNCCPRGTEFRNGACRSFQTSPPPPPKACPEGFVGKPPRCCPRGTEYRNGACRGPEPAKVRECPADRPVGTFPNCCPQNARFTGGQCRCVQGFQFVNGRCMKVQVPRECPAGQIFINGECRRLAIPNVPKPQQPRDCGPGYRPLPKPNKYGAWCEPIEQRPQQPKCPPDRPNGTPPNCCPSGTTFRQGSCWPTSCPPNMTGVPPNCERICPPGTVKQGQTCVRPAPTPKPAPKDDLIVR